MSESVETVRHTTDDRQKDIEFGNQYRLEYIKHLITISSGLFAFTVVFMKDFLGQAARASQWQAALVVGWAGLLVSIVAGIQHMRCWASFFSSWGTHPHEQGRARREQLDRKRKLVETIQLYAFFLGVACLLLYAAINLWSAPATAPAS